jgi:hypothetical protein
MTKQELKAEVEAKVPEFARACQRDVDMVLMHQDAFAAGYQDHEFMLLGKAVKYAGLCGKEVRVIGRNSETLPRVQ